MNTEQLATLSKAHVLVVGDIMLDRYWHGGTSRISPEAPVPVVHVNDIEERVGGAGNVALNIVALNAQASVIALTGKDEAATSLKHLLDKASINDLLHPLDDAATITKLRVISRHQQLIRLDFENGFANADHQQLSELVDTHLEQCDAIVFSDYGKGTLSEVQSLINLARAKNVPILVDPKGSDFSRYSGATLLTPNLSEFEAIVGPCPDDSTLVDKGLQFLDAHKIETLMVTRGEHGMTLLQSNKPPCHIATVAQEVFDVTGAGDTVIAVLAAALGAKVDIESAMHIANTAAGIVVGKLGTATASAKELEYALQSRLNSDSSVVSPDDLKQIVAQAKQRDETIVMTNGCFDLLHAGHVSYLERARQLGDCLIVAVNDDDSVRRLKGSTRPVNSLADRMRVLAGLGCVDWVVPFSDDTPESLICSILPDKLVKGGDYTVEQIAGHQCVNANGGETIILDLVKGKSSSAVIQRMQELDA